MESGFVSAVSDDETVAVKVDVVLVADADAADDADARPSSIRDETIRNNATANVDRKGMKYQEWYALAGVCCSVLVWVSTIILSSIYDNRFLIGWIVMTRFEFIRSCNGRMKP